MNTIDPAAYEGDIVSRLRNWRGLHLAHGGDLFEEAADEIERLRKGFPDIRELERMRDMLLEERTMWRRTHMTLTADEREAVGVADQCIQAQRAQHHPEETEACELLDKTLATLRSLLERTK